MSSRTVIVLVLLAACGTSHGPDDAGADAGPAVSLHRPPPRPDVADGESGPEVVFLLNEVQWDQREDEDWSRIGFDLDGLVTTESDPVVECVAPAPTASPTRDGVDGTDNTFGEAVMPIVVLSLGAPDEEIAARALQAMGIGALLVRIRDWNGAEDDPMVTADLFATTTGLDAAGGVRVAETTVLAGDLEQPRARDNAAYVASGALVMRLPDRDPVEIAFGTDTVTMLLTDAQLVVQLGGRATLAGRWSVLDVLAALPQLGACSGTEDEAALSRLLDLAADLRSLPGTGGSGAVCDAISVGIELSVAPAGLAGIGPPPALTPLCP